MEAVVVKGKNYAFVLIASEEYWKRLRQRSVESGGALAFVRKGQVGPIRAKKIIFYIKKPAMQIRGFADFIERLKGDSDEMWRDMEKRVVSKQKKSIVPSFKGETRLLLSD